MIVESARVRECGVIVCLSALCGGVIFIPEIALPRVSFSLSSFDGCRMGALAFEWLSLFSGSVMTRKIKGRAGWSTG